MLFLRFLSDLVSALETGKRVDGVVCLKHGSSANVSFTSLYLAKLNLLLSVCICLETLELGSSEILLHDISSSTELIRC